MSTLHLDQRAWLALWCYDETSKGAILRGLRTLKCSSYKIYVARWLDKEGGCASRCDCERYLLSSTQDNEARSALENWPWNQKLVQVQATTKYYSRTRWRQPVHPCTLNIISSRFLSCIRIHRRFVVEDFSARWGLKSEFTNFRGYTSCVLVLALGFSHSVLEWYQHAVFETERMLIRRRKVLWWRETFPQRNQLHSRQSGHYIFVGARFPHFLSFLGRSDTNSNGKPPINMLALI